MKIGSLVYATEQGLGRLAKSFYDAGVITHPIIVRHPSHPLQANWYPVSTPDVPIRGTYVGNPAIRDMIREVDALLFFETPFAWDLFRLCKEMRKRTFLMTMYECTPAQLPALPDVFLCPSVLDLQYFRKEIWSNGDVGQPFLPYSGDSSRTVYFTPVPVDVPWGFHTTAEVFVHNAGNGSFRDRNGTQAILEAWKYVKSPAKLILRAQRAAKLPYIDFINSDKRIDLRIGTFPYNQLWHEGDVFIFPERFNGLSLPLQEARAAGMLVMAGDRFPMNTWLPKEPLIPVADTQKGRIGPPYMEFDEAIYNPGDIAAKVDEWWGKDIMDYSMSGRTWGIGMSWATLKPKYLEVLSS